MSPSDGCAIFRIHDSIDPSKSASVPSRSMSAIARVFFSITGSSIMGSSILRLLLLVARRRQRERLLEGRVAQLPQDDLRELAEVLLERLELGRIRHLVDVDGLRRAEERRVRALGAAAGR